MYPNSFVQQGDDIILSLHDEAGLPATPVSQRSPQGAVIDSSAADIVFRVPSINFTKALTPSTTDPRGLIFALTAAEAASLPDGARWLFLDRSDAVPVDLAKGVIRKYR